MSNQKTDNNNIVIDFSHFPFCFRSVSVDSFTNKLNNSIQFFENCSRLIEKDLSALSSYSFENIHQNTKHSHIISPNSKEYSKVITIIKELYKVFSKSSNLEKDFELFFMNNINDYSIWQLGILGGLVGIRSLNFFYVLFIDYHHLIYPSQKYNQDNYKKYNFCPMTSYLKENYK